MKLLKRHCNVVCYQCLSNCRCYDSGQYISLTTVIAVNSYSVTSNHVAGHHENISSLTVLLHTVPYSTVHTVLYIHTVHTVQYCMHSADTNEPTSFSHRTPRHPIPIVTLLLLIILLLFLFILLLLLLLLLLFLFLPMRLQAQ